MGAITNRPQRIAVDANVLFDLAADVDDVFEAVSIIRGRLHDAHFLIPPTVQHELAHWTSRGDAGKRELARSAIQLSQSLRIVPASLIAPKQVERIAEQIRECELIPEEEVNDSLVLAESAFLGCSILLTSDEHLRGIDFERLTLELQTFDVVAPIIATPREIVRKFFRR